MYVKNCERDRVIDFEQRSGVHNGVRYNAFFLMDPDDRVIMELQCISFTKSKAISVLLSVTELFTHYSKFTSLFRLLLV